MIDARFLKIDDAVALHETAVAEQHGASERSLVRAGCEKIVERIEKAATHAGEPVEESQSRMTHNRQKLAVPQRALQLNVLASEIAAKIKAAGIAKIVDRARPDKSFDAIPGARRRWSRARRFRAVVR